MIEKDIAYILVQPSLSGHRITAQWKSISTKYCSVVCLYTNFHFSSIILILFLICSELATLIYFNMALEIVKRLAAKW